MICPPDDRADCPRLSRRPTCWALACGGRPAFNDELDRITTLIQQFADDSVRLQRGVVMMTIPPRKPEATS